MSWVTVSDTILNRLLTSPELVAARTIALEDEQEDPVPEVVAGVIDEARGSIAAWRANTLGPVDTLPERLIPTVLAIARYRIWNRLPGLEVTEGRTQEYKDALRLLERVANGKVAIEQPEEAADPKEQNPGGAFEKVSGGDRHATRTKLDGLL